MELLRKYTSVKKSIISALFIYSVLAASAAFSAPSTFSYQGRIVGADGAGLEYASVSFLFTVTSPDGICVLYREQRNGVNMQNSKGVFDTPIGSGTKLFPSSPTFTLLDAFNNTAPLGCDGGATYSPVADDGRLLRVQFHDGAGWKLITPDSVIRSVPFAGYAANSTKLSGKTAGEFVLKTDLPAACGVGQVITFDGTNFSCVTDAGGGASVSSVVGSGPIVVTGTTTATVSATIGTTAGTLAAGDDSRFTDSRIPSGSAGGDLTGTYPAPTIAANAVTTTKIIDGAVTTAKIPDSAITSAKILDGTVAVTDFVQTGIDGQVFRNNGGVWQVAKLNYTDLVNNVSASPWPGSCPAGQFVTWSSASDSFSCAAVSSAAIAAGLGYTAANAARTITAGVGLTGGGDLTANRTLAVDVGVSAGQIPQLDAGGKLLSSILPTSVTNGLWTESSGDIYRSTGNVGIGSTAPASLLHVDNGFITSGRYGNAGALVLRSAGGTQGSPTALTSTSLAGTLMFRGHDGAGAYRDMGSIVVTATGAVSPTNTASDMYFMTTPIGSNVPLERLRVNSEGNVGFGTAAPTALIHTKSTQANPYIIERTTGNNVSIQYKNTEGALYTGLSSNENFAIGANADLTSSPWFTIASATGNVGIGTTAPGSPLHVNGIIRATQICFTDGTNCKDVSTAWGGGSGTVTSVSSANADIAVGGTADDPVLTLNSGVGADKILKLDGTGEIPAVDGSLITNLNPANLSAVVPESKGGTGEFSYTDGQILIGDSSDSGLAKQVLTGDAAMTKAGLVTVNGIKGKTVSATPTLDGQILRYDGTNWTPNFISMFDLRSTVTGTTTFAAGCTAGQTLTWSAATDNLACTNISVAAATQITGTLPIANGGTGAATASQGFVFAGPATGGAGAPTFRALASTDLPSTITNGLWTESGGNVYRNSGNVGIGTATPASSLQVNGAIQMGDDTALCPGTSNVKLGAMRFNSGMVQVCRANGWTPVGGSNASSFGAVIANGSYGSGSTAITGFTEEFDVGNDFNPTTGSFTAPAAGQYLIAASAHGITTSTNWMISLLINGAVSNYYGSRFSTAAGAINPISNLSAVLNLNQGDVIRLQLYGPEQSSSSVVVRLSGSRLDGGSLAGSTADNLGNGVATSNITLGNYWLSGDGGANGLRIDSSGNVGIGTATPEAQMELYGTSSAAPRNLQITQVSNDNQGAWTFLKKARGPSSAIQSGDAIGGIIARPFDGTGVVQPGHAGFYANGTIAAGSVPTDYVIATGSSTATEKMRITSTGNVGIGTSSPTATLQVNKDSGSIFDRSLQARNGSFNNLFFGHSAATTHFGNNQGALAFHTASDMGVAGASIPTNERMRISDTGEVGIGTTSPVDKLEVHGSSMAIRVHETANDDATKVTRLFQRTGTFTGDIVIDVAAASWKSVIYKIRVSAASGNCHYEGQFYNNTSISNHNQSVNAASGGVGALSLSLLSTQGYRFVIPLTSITHPVVEVEIIEGGDEAASFTGSDITLTIN